MVLVPGFSQPASAWSAVLDALHPSLDATAIEVPDALDFVATADAIGRNAIGQGGAGEGSAGRDTGRAVYVGYSMGGRLALQLALDDPERVAGLVLVSASPGIADPDARAARARADAGLAAEVERDGVAVFLERWLAQPLFAGLTRDQAGFGARVAEMSVTRLVHQLTVLGQGAMPPAWDRLAAIAVPVLFVTGALDTKYGDLATEMCACNPEFEHAVLPGGHAVLLEHPTELAQQVSRFVHEIAPVAE